MELIYSVNLIFILVVNILFFFSGICLNSLVIVSFWRSVQLRKKLCYFTIILLSCCDLLAVVVSHPSTGLVAMLWLTHEKFYVHSTWLVILVDLSTTLLCFSVLALFVMSFDQYLATHYPIFHRTSVTKKKLLTLFIILVIFKITILAISVKHQVIPYGLLIFGIIFVSPMLLINYKLFTIASKRRRNKQISPEMKKSSSLKNISSCLLVVACLIGLSIISLVYVLLKLTLKEKEFPELVGLWARTVASMNSTFNCLIFYWKNKTLRTEGIKVIKSMKICRKNNPALTILHEADNNMRNQEKKKDIQL